MTSISTTLDTSSDSTPLSYYATLKDYALIVVSGEDAADFLQAQLTQDIGLATPQQAQLALWCNAKGRTLASCLIWQDATDAQRFYLLLRQDIVEPTIKRLTMFVLRLKVSIEVIACAVVGFWSEPTALQSEQINTISHHYSVSQREDTIWVQYPTLGDTHRYLAINLNPEVDILSLTPPTPTEALSVADSTWWAALDIASGLPWIEQANREVFIPQSINFDAIGAINFKKGCFPGQEIVARSHYLGNLKRRAFIGVAEEADEATVPAADVIQQERPVGQIVNVAKLPDDHGTWVLFETRLEAVAEDNEQPLHIGSATGPTLRSKQPPYPLEKPEN